MEKDDELAQKRIERRRFEYNRVIEMISATTAMERAALRPPFILNGGALIVYLALYGAVLTKAPSGAEKLDTALAKWAMGLWIAGLLFGTVATAMGFRSQWAFRRHRGRQVYAEAATEEGKEREAGAAEAHSDDAAREGQNFRTVAMWAIVLSVALFLAGIVTAFFSLP